ncbi:putative transcriptional regulator [Paramagnetospirillum magnetotacticum MS-1]|uniref:Putative transcriptional regulator n=2 Tax=Paramagnetospirillum magnetotacticum TaxID=188 RepID=A0A0C2V677_PARME|nr:putative transcriptional regulator [Paramagnetospirillum magnetotacticum MS-1]
MVRCLVSDDDEAFTYNKRVARLATIQEHYMIVRALERGVPEEKLAKALNVDVSLIWRRRALLDGICPEVVDLLKDKSVNPTSFEVLRKMKPPRQIEAAELMTAAGNFSSAYAKALLAATRQHDLVHPDRPKKIGGITAEQMARMEREMETLQRDFKAVEASYGDDVLNLVIATGYLSKLVANPEIARFLESRHPDFLDKFRVIINAASLDDSN